MKKIWKGLLALGCACLLLAGCGSKGPENVDIDAVSGELLSGITYQDPLEKIEGDIVLTLYGMEGKAEAYSVYMGSGATAEQIAVFACADASQAKDEAEPALQAYVEDQIRQFESYIPEEVAKLKDAVIRQAGKYVVLSVSDDSGKAKEILDKYLK